MGESQHKEWPVDEEHSVSTTGWGPTTGQMQTMSKGAWFQSPGAAVPNFLNGYILARYKAKGDRSGVLSLPTTSKIDILGMAPGSRMGMNASQHGAVCWLGS